MLWLFTHAAHARNAPGLVPRPRYVLHGAGHVIDELGELAALDPAILVRVHGCDEGRGRRGGAAGARAMMRAPKAPHLGAVQDTTGSGS